MTSSRNWRGHFLSVAKQAILCYNYKKRGCSMEKLICKSLLWKMELSNGEDYNTTLDKMFLENSNNDLLLELESCSSDSDATFDILQRYWKYKCGDFSVDDFGKCLLEDLKTVYFSNAFIIAEFGKRCYQLWQQLPSEMHTKEPFHTLSYANEPLSWNDEEQTRKLYEDLFDFYK